LGFSGDQIQETLLPLDAIREVISTAGRDDVVFSEQVQEGIRACTTKFCQELVRLCSQASQAQGKAVVDTNDLKNAYSELKLQSVLPVASSSEPQPEGDKQPKIEFKLRSSPASPSPTKSQLTLFPMFKNTANTTDSTDPENDKQIVKCLYQQNNGHSQEVQAWIKKLGSTSLVACLGSATIFKKIIDSIRETVSQPEINFFFGPGGVQVQAVGPSHVSLLSLELKPSGFETYTCPQPVTLGLNIAGLSSFFKQVVKNDQVTILHVSGTRDCTFIIEDGTRVSEFTMKLKHMESQTLQITEGVYASHWVMPSSALQRVCRDLKACVNNDNVHIAAKDNHLSFTGAGRYGRHRIVCDESMAKAISMNGPCDILFSLPYLHSFTKAGSLSNTLLLKLGEESPLMCGYELENLGFLNFYLAPKLKEASDFPNEP